MVIHYFILLLYLGEVGKIWVVARKSPGSRQEVARKSFLNFFSIVTGLVDNYFVAQLLVTRWWTKDRPTPHNIMLFC